MVLNSAWAQQDTLREQSIRTFAKAIAATVAILEECVQQNVAEGQAAQIAYEKIRTENLELFLEVERAKEFAGQLAAMRAGMAAEPPAQRQEACPAAPVLLSRLSEAVTLLAEIPK
jgi:hypothetical protein